MSMSDAPARATTLVTGPVALTTSLRRQIRERLHGALISAAGPGHDPAEDRNDLVDEVEALRTALVKLEAGYYGVCESCEGPIQFERLDALPTERFCGACHTWPMAGGR
jgi:hypothetical protein